MDVTNNFKIIVIGISWLIFSACTNQENVGSSASVATQFKNALNTNDTATLVQLIELPVLFIEQEWETLQDGIGFTLGKQNVSTLNNKQVLKDFIVKFAKRVDIEGVEAMLIEKGEYSNFKKEFSNNETKWKKLNVYLYKRGEGDVEHIMLLGLNPSNNKIRLVYVN